MEWNEGRAVVDALEGSLAFEDVSFSYGERPVLSDVSLRVAAGETSTRQIDSLEAGEHRVTLEAAPFEATIRAVE